MAAPTPQDRIEVGVVISESITAAIERYFQIDPINPSHPFAASDLAREIADSLQRSLEAAGFSIERT